MVALIEHMQGKGGVWFATLADIGAHIQGLIDRNEWTPSVERIPFWADPVPQVARPIRYGSGPVFASTDCIGEASLSI